MKRAGRVRQAAMRFTKGRRTATSAPKALTRVARRSRVCGATLVDSKIPRVRIAAFRAHQGSSSEKLQTCPLRAHAAGAQQVVIRQIDLRPRYATYKYQWGTRRRNVLLILLESGRAAAPMSCLIRSGCGMVTTAQ